MADIFEEVDDALKQERMEKIWNDYKGLIISVLVGIVFLTGAYSGFTSWNNGKNQDQTHLIVSATASENPEEVLIAGLENLRSGGKSVSTLIAAGFALNDDNIGKAEEILKTAIEAGNLKKEYDHYARILLTRIMMNSSDNDQDFAPEQPFSLLQPVLDDPKSLWRNQAILNAALIESSLDKKSDALNRLQQINHSHVTASARMLEMTKAIEHVYTQKSPENTAQ